MLKFLIALSLLLAGTVAHAADWPQWLGPQRDGVWREEGILDTFPKDGPKLLWKKPIGIGYAGPAVVGGRVYVTDRQLNEGQKNPTNPFDTKTPVTGKERILCLDAKTGETVWKHEYDSSYQISYAAGPRSTPTVEGRHVYSLGAMGDLVCLNAATGAVVWSKNFVKDYAAKVPVWGFAAPPLVDGDKLICLAGGSDDRLVIAFDKLTGKELWTSQSCLGDFGYCPPMIYEFGGRRQLIIWHARAIVGLDPDSGKRRWIVPFVSKAALTVPTPRKIGDTLFITSFYHGSMLVKVSADATEVVWKSKAKGEMATQTTDLSSIMTTPAVKDGYIYGVCSYGQLRCIKVDTGERVWETMKATRGALTAAKVSASEEPADSERWGHAFIVEQADRYFLFNEQGDMIIAKLTPKGYEELSRAHLIDPTNTMARGRKVVWMHPAFADRKVIVRNDEEIACFDLGK